MRVGHQPRSAARRARRTPTENDGLRTDALAGRERDRHVLDAVDEVRPETLHVAGELEVVEAREHLHEDLVDLRAGQVRSEAEVRTPATERDVLVRRAVHP